MSLSITAAGDPDWNSNLLTIVPQTAFENEVLVCIHKEGDDPMQGMSIRISVAEYINAARALGIIVGQKLPPKPEPPQ